MSSHYLFRQYNNLPNYFGYQYFIPQSAAWANYTVPFATPPGDFYQPHYYYPRNDFEQTPNVTCFQTNDNRFCPTNTTVTSSTTDRGTTLCEFPNRVQVSSVKNLAVCENPNSWPASYVAQYTQ
jgi:hypothetical protein